MRFIGWTDQMSVGVPLLDTDHKIFIELINDLEECAKYPAYRDRVKDSLRRLIDYSRYHFGREEQVMAACGYPGIEAHKEEHAEFTKHLREVGRPFDSDPNAVLDAEVLDFLKNWLTHHMLIQDMAYRPYAEGNVAAASAAKAFPPSYMAAI